MQARYGAALAAQPLPPAQFTLFFVEGKDEFTDESKRIVDSVFAEIAKRPVADVIVIGHTDTRRQRRRQRRAVAPARRGRARRVRRAAAWRPTRSSSIGRGKREPAVPTGDGVAEPRNRRVEILVR